MDLFSRDILREKNVKFILLAYWHVSAQFESSLNSNFESSLIQF